MQGLARYPGIPFQILQAMKTFRHFSLLLPVLLVLFLPALLSWQPANLIKASYTIEAGSRLYLEGSSNVTPFKCECEHQFQPLRYELESFDGGKYARFNRTTLALPIRSLDCGNKGINKDMAEALRAQQYPNILMDLHKATQEAGNHLQDGDGWVPIQAAVSLSIGGKSRQADMQVRGRRLGNGRYQFTGRHALKMSDFGIDPPRPMMGLIKVRDGITIHLDLVVRVH